MRLSEAFSASYDYIFFPSETHLSVHMQHLLFTRGDHVSVNHAGATLPSEKAISSIDGSQLWGEAPNISLPFICFPSPSIPLSITVIAASRYQVQLNAPSLDTSVLLLDGGDRSWCIWILWEATCFWTGERALKENSIQGLRFLPPSPSLFLSLWKGAMHWFNSQENQLKAGTGLTYTQWSKIDQRHPAWTNHRSEGEASMQTWKVQEAMTELMARKMLLMMEEKRLWLCLYPLIYLRFGHCNSLAHQLPFG